MEDVLLHTNVKMGDNKEVKHFVDVGSLSFNNEKDKFLQNGHVKSTHGVCDTKDDFKLAFETDIKNEFVENPVDLIEPVTAGSCLNDANCTSEAKKVYECSICNFTTHKRKKVKAHWKTHKSKIYQCDICKKVFKNLGILKRHQLTHTGRKHYLCDLCGRGYLHIVSLQYHKLTHLQHNPIAGERTKYLQSKKELNMKSPSVVPRQFLCDLCGRVFKLAMSLKAHLKKHHDGVVETCKSDLVYKITAGNAIDFDYEQYLNRKRPGPKRKNPLTIDKKVFRCSECPYAAARRRDVAVHLRTHTGEKPFPCNICGKFFSKESVVERHKLTHGIQKTCGKSSQQVHLKTISPWKDSKGSSGKNGCLSDGCVKNKQNLENLEPSNKSHTDLLKTSGTHFLKSRYINDVAMYKQAVVYPESKHLGIHSDYHNTTYPRWVGSDTTMGNTVGVIPASNDESTKGFVIVIERSGQSSHMGIPQHQADAHAPSDVNKSPPVNREDICKEVGVPSSLVTTADVYKGYLETSNNLSYENEGGEELIRVPHVIRLSGRDIKRRKKDTKDLKCLKEKTDKNKRVKGMKKKHKCEECPYETFLSRDMRVHMRKHSGERPFPCPICGKRFSKESVVKRHQSVHTGLRPYICEYCFKSFTQLSNLKIHKIGHFDISTGLLKDNIKKYKHDNIKSETLHNQNKLSDDTNILLPLNPDNMEIKLENLCTDSTNVTDETFNKRKKMEFNRNIHVIREEKPDIDEIRVDEVNIKNEKDFELKTESCSSDDEYLSKIQELILQTYKNKTETPDKEINASKYIKEELIDTASDWQNEEQFSDVKDEFKENEENFDLTIFNDNTIKIEAEERKNRIERKRLKKMKKKLKKLNRSMAKANTMGNINNISQDVATHMIRERDKPIYKCDKCHYSVANKRDLIVHTRSHSGEKLFSCDICKKNFSKQSVVNRHKMIHFGIKPFTCHLCGLSFTQSNSLKKHMETKHGIRNNDMPFKCDLCSASFAQEKSLKTHKHSHLRKRNNEFTCHICGKVFPHECRLKSHLLLHDERQFTCCICGKKFLRKYDLKYHMSIHTQAKQCICHVCGGIFSTLATLNLHLRSHLSLVEFTCNLCEAKFSKSGELVQHKALIHNKEKSFQCIVCSKYFSNAGSLKKHQVIHSISRSHQCQVCFKHFKLSAHLQKHYVSTKHGSVDVHRTGV